MNPKEKSLQIHIKKNYSTTTNIKCNDTNIFIPKV